MKHFVIASVLLIIIISGVCINGYCVRKTVSEMKMSALALPETEEEFISDGDKTMSFSEKWYSCHGFLSYSLHMCELERACEAVADMVASFESGSFEDYASAKQRFLSVISELDSGERIMPENIF